MNKQNKQTNKFFLKKQKNLHEKLQNWRKNTDHEKKFYHGKN